MKYIYLGDIEPGKLPEMTEEQQQQCSTNASSMTITCAPTDTLQPEKVFE